MNAATTAQMPPVGPHPDVSVLLVGALLWSTAADATEVLALVADDDIESNPLAAVLAALRRLATTGKPHGPQLVLDELRRTGDLRDNGVGGELRAATTCGADPGAARHYAAAVVAAALRRCAGSAGVALTATARDCREAEIAPMAARAMESVTDCAARLAALRGESL